MPKQPSKKLVEKAKLLEYVKNFEAVREYPVPELAETLKMENPVLMVKGASLNDHIRARELSSAPLMVLGEIYQQMTRGESPNLEKLRQFMVSESVHPKTEFELRIFKECVIEPAFTYGEVISLSETMPGLVNRVVAFALGITGEDPNGNRKTD